MTGRELLAEAAAQETARVYGQLCREDRYDHQQRIPATVDHLDMTDALDAGWPPSRLMGHFGITYDTAQRAIRKHQMMRRAA